MGWVCCRLDGAIGILGWLVRVRMGTLLSGVVSSALLIFDFMRLAGEITFWLFLVLAMLMEYSSMCYSLHCS